MIGSKKTTNRKTNMEKQIEELKKAVGAVEEIAASLVKHEYHGKSAAMTAVRSRLNGAKEMLDAHLLWIKANPVPANSPESKVQSPKSPA